MTSHHVERFRNLSLASGLMCWLGGGTALAETTEDEPARFHAQTYTTDSGLPQTRVACLAQTPEGYLWCGTWFGLARFDGVRFVTFNRHNTSAFGASDAIQQLVVDAQGQLWVGTAKALLRRTEHGFVEVPLPGGWGGYGVSGLWPRPDRGVWVAGEIGFVDLDGTNTTITPLPGNSGVPRVIAGRNGVPFFYRKFVKGSQVWWPDKTSNNLREIAILAEKVGGDGPIVPAPSGLWAFCGVGLVPLSEAGQAEHQALPALLTEAGIQNAAPARDGGLWLTDLAGRLWHWRPGAVKLLSVDSAPDFSRGVVGMFEDQEANLWVACDAGLVRLRQRVIRSFTTRDGLPADDTWSVCRSRSGGVWVGGQLGGVCRIANEKVTETLPPVREVGIGGLGIRAVLEHSQGRLLANATQVYEFASGRWQAWSNTAEFSGALYEDTKGRLWIGGSGAAWNDGTGWHRWSRINGLPDASVRVICQSRDGAMWFGTQRGGLARLDEQNGEVHVFGRAEGLASDEVWAIHETPDNALWVGGNRGLARLSPFPETKVFPFTPEHGLPDDAVNWILEDAHGYLWLSGLKGIHRVPRSELEAVARGEHFTASCATYGVADGMETAETNGEHAPAGCVDEAGRLWFPTGKGVVCIDPKLIDVSEHPPTVVLEEAKIDRESFPVTISREAQAKAGLLKLAPGRARLVQFRYTTPTFVSAERVRFRYRLRGLSETWFEAGEERVAYFYDLKPREYTFEVTAASAHGVWAEVPAVFIFSLAPRFTQTAWFPAALILGGIALTGAFVTWRLRWQRRLLKLEQQQALANERARIARDLHDDLGASLTGLALKADLAQRHLENAPAAAGQVSAIASSTRALVDTMRETVWALNPKHDTIESLARFLAQQVEDSVTEAGLRCRLELPDRFPALTIASPLRHNVCLLVKEALHNVLKHSGAREVRFSLSLHSDQLCLAVKDDGRGFSEALSRGGFGHPTGNGIANMQQRAQSLGGHLDLTTGEGRGTSISIRIPIHSEQTRPR